MASEYPFKILLGEIMTLKDLQLMNLMLVQLGYDFESSEKRKKSVRVLFRNKF